MTPFTIESGIPWIKSPRILSVARPDYFRTRPFVPSCLVREVQEGIRGIRRMISPSDQNFFNGTALLSGISDDQAWRFVRDRLNQGVLIPEDHCSKEGDDMIPHKTRRPEPTGAGVEVCPNLNFSEFPGIHPEDVWAGNRTFRRRTVLPLHRKNIPYPPSLRHARPIPRRWIYG